MRLGRIILLVALVLALGLVVIFMMTRGNQTAGPDIDVAATEQALQSVPVVVLKFDVRRGEVFNEAQLEIRNLPTELVTEGSSFSSFAQVVGETARIDLSAGTFLNSSMLVGGIGGEGDVETSFQGSDHAWLIGEGMVAFPVPINRFSSVAYGLTRGDYVDVIVTMAFVDLDTQFQTITPNQTAGVLTPGANMILEGGAINYGEFGFNSSVAQSGTGGALSPQGRAELDALLDQPFYYVPSETQRARVVSQRVFQNLAVLNVGTFPVYDSEGKEVFIATDTPELDDGVAPPQDDQGAALPQMPTAEPPDIVTLIMWPQDAVTLNYLLYTGAQVTLALRGAGSVNESPTATDAVTLQYLMDVYRIPLPVRLPYGTNPRVDVLEPPMLETDLVENNNIQQ
ncbi:MAG: SAF domain-containing protein [Anaerolineales bacterium]